MKNIVGDSFSRLTIIEDLGNIKGRRRVICECECGKVKNIQYQHLKSGATRSCGCLQKEIVTKRETKHGGRGITVCVSWENFINFRSWALSNGYKDGLELDRKNNSGNYTEDNCRFITTLENNHNRRITVRVDGLTLREISEKFYRKLSKIQYKYYRIIKTKNPTINDLIS